MQNETIKRNYVSKWIEVRKLFRNNWLRVRTFFNSTFNISIFFILPICFDYNTRLV